LNAGNALITAFECKNAIFVFFGFARYRVVQKHTLFEVTQ